MTAALAGAAIGLVQSVLGPRLHLGPAVADLAVVTVALLVACGRAGNAIVAAVAAGLVADLTAPGPVGPATAALGLAAVAAALTDRLLLDRRLRAGVAAAVAAVGYGLGMNALASIGAGPSPGTAGGAGWVLPALVDGLIAAGLLALAQVRRASAA